MKRLIALSLGIAFPVETHLYFENNGWVSHLVHAIILCMNSFFAIAGDEDFGVLQLAAFHEIWVWILAIIFPFLSRFSRWFSAVLSSTVSFWSPSIHLMSCRLISMRALIRCHYNMCIRINPGSDVPDTLYVSASLLISSVITSLNSHDSTYSVVTVKGKCEFFASAISWCDRVQRHHDTLCVFRWRKILCRYSHGPSTG